MKKIEPWKFDAGSIHYSLDLYNHLYINEEIKNYLQVGDHDHHFLLVGSKGTGKTLFLNYKSLLYTQDLGGYKKYPSDQLCENLLISHSTFSKEDLSKYSTSEIWTKIWLFSLMVISCKTNDIELGTELNKLISPFQSLSSIIINLLSNRKTINTYFKHIDYLLSRIELIQNGICIFIDNIDQSFNEFLVNYKSKNQVDESITPVEVWLNAQVGLITSIYTINRHNSHIKIYATVRKEVFQGLESSLKINYKAYATFLDYSESEVKEIFEKNISLMSNDLLVEENATSKTRKFLGFETMPHIAARKHRGNGSKRNENSFNFFYRHTFGRPREIVLIGNLIFNRVINNSIYKSLPIQDKIEKIRWEINSISREILESYLSELIPKFDFNELMCFLEIIQCNVIPNDFLRGHILEIAKKYFSFGLLGCTVQIPRDKNPQYIQRFLPAGDYVYKQNTPLPTSRYYLTHPAIDSYFTDLFDILFYNRFNIIGPMYPFYNIPFMTKLYDVAFSFSGDNREYVLEVVNECKVSNIRVFYDEHEKSGLWGNDLYQHLSNIYRYYSKYCIVFISESYISKVFTMYEYNEMKEQEKKEQHEYILPVRFDNSKLPGLSENIVYINAMRTTPRNLCKIIKEKLKTTHNSTNAQ